jgi:hypothetical protein
LHLFQIQEEEQNVRVLRVWHGYRNAINAADVKKRWQANEASEAVISHARGTTPRAIL